MRTRSRVCRGAPTQASTDQRALLLLKGIIRRQRLNNLALLPVVWRFSLIIGHEFCIRPVTFQKSSLGEANGPLSRLSVTRPRLTPPAFKGGNPDHFPWKHASPGCDLLQVLFCWAAWLLIRSTWAPAVNEGQPIHYLRLTQAETWSGIRGVDLEKEQL